MIIIDRIRAWWRGETLAEEIHGEIVEVRPMPPGDGWMPWRGWDAYRHAEVETWHETWGDKIGRERPLEMRPERNVNGLWWRPVGRMP